MERPTPAQPAATKGERDHEVLPTFYASLLGDVKKVGRDHGYAILIHGSLCRDCDLVAVPWTDEAVDADTLVKAVATATRTFNTDGWAWVKKPHGRMGYQLFFGGKPYFDLSVMPRDELRPLVKELIDILETVEESDLGREFHPTTIQSCRALTSERLSKLMPAITKLVK